MDADAGLAEGAPEGWCRSVGETRRVVQGSLGGRAFNKNAGVHTRWSENPLDKGTLKGDGVSGLGRRQTSKNLGFLSPLMTATSKRC
jgi:hypothetical protein